LDIRFEHSDVVVLVETKPIFVELDEKQLAEYLQEERVLHWGKKIIAILANTRTLGPKSFLKISLESPEISIIAPQAIKSLKSTSV